MDTAFGGWLLDQKGRPDWIGSLATSAAHDPQFPRWGGVDEVRARLSHQQAEADMFEALDAAEDEYLCRA